MNAIVPSIAQSSSPQIIDLGPTDVDRIVELERRCFIPPLQADSATLFKRFAAGHQMVGIEVAGRLSALVGYYYTMLDPEHLDNLPASETEFCLVPSQPRGNALVVYNLEVSPEQRGLEYPRLLLNFALREAKQLGAVHAFGNARLPSYAGSDPRFRQELIVPNPLLRSAIDAYLECGRFPDASVLDQDPRLGLYRALTGCTFLKLLPDFAPYDTASGGMRLIVHLGMVNWADRLA